PGHTAFNVNAEMVGSTQRGTVLEHNGAKVSTVEHLMSALFSMGIDNALIETDGPEIPILDGSAQSFAEAIFADGAVYQSRERRYLIVKEPISVKDAKSGSEITIYPDSGFFIEVLTDFNSKVIGNQYARYTTETNYLTEIAPCRTFVFLHDLEPLIKNNLIKGGDLDNAVVIAENRIEGKELDAVARLFNKSGVGSIERGYVNIDEPKFSNECARHKLLDLLGDLALAGIRIKGRVVAYKPGHKINTDIAKLLIKMAKESLNSRDIPQFDPNAEPVVDINGIKKLLPHRPPFLMVDRIISMTHDVVVGIKTVGVNEGYFIGHFPDEPIMPGVLIIEAMAQVGGILVLSDLEEPERYSTYFAKIDNAKFKKKVVPGDVLVIKLTLTAPMKRSIVCMKGEVYVGNTLACEADLIAQVIKNK
ncbi:MAG: bifunctional UDP-3-O-[3-hydroxymyristoyl] N-acetylglucosamine deacetylase/3-hydroxyacyl-ACP dehydratase, partial [Bacteroidales bacterium]|nr:bifunctional UDP-3-O-[3-hydroxymyristoyl] N-acetylglucosamine deacetylase/3-hydroxyacyl-ACP dehydratase [Bacteroidales bacterium]